MAQHTYTNLPEIPTDSASTVQQETCRRPGRAAKYIAHDQRSNSVCKSLSIRTCTSPLRKAEKSTAQHPSQSRKQGRLFELHKRNRETRIKQQCGQPTTTCTLANLTSDVKARKYSSEASAAKEKAQVVIETSDGPSTILNKAHPLIH